MHWIRYYITKRNAIKITLQKPGLNIKEPSFFTNEVSELSSVNKLKIISEYISYTIEGKSGQTIQKFRMNQLSNEASDNKREH
jgi:hypothetical protein